MERSPCILCGKPLGTGANGCSAMVNGIEYVACGGHPNIPGDNKNNFWSKIRTFQN
ncbi:hypothetical protein LCGC14_2257030, partial [marine sediment metagenome]